MKKTLSELELNECGMITDIKLEENKFFKLMNLGIVKGEKIKCCFKSPFEDPIAYQVKGTIFALRKSDAGKIEVDLHE